MADIQMELVRLDGTSFSLKVLGGLLAFVKFHFHGKELVATGLGPRWPVASFHASGPRAIG